MSQTTQASPIPCRVLVIDDSEELLALVSLLLKKDGFDVVTADSGKAGLERWQRGGIDLVLCDLAMPDMTGDEIFAAIQAKSPGFPCVVLTANGSVDKAVGLMRAGAVDYILKPVARDLFVVRMRAVRERVLMASELIALREICAPEGSSSLPLIVGNDRSMLALFRRMSLTARTDAPILIHGESGTGKEIVARSVHELSRRSDGPFVAVNTGAISVSLWESEFFGHVKGAFTDAKTAAPGLIASAQGGTLFLDEIGEIPLAAQAKLLRFIQERLYRPVGSTKELPADVRIVAATHRDLKKLIGDGLFREDLYYRLNVVPLSVPPLRERRGDIPSLAQHFLRKYARDFGVAVEGFTPAALSRLTQHDWPGNVRELENLVQQMVAVATHTLIGAGEVPLASSEFVAAKYDGAAPGLAPANLPSDESVPPLIEARHQATREFERQYLTRALAVTEGNITRAAEMCKVPRKTFWRLLKNNHLTAVREGVASKPGRPRKTKV